MTTQQIQNLLQYLGYYTIRVDGISGPGTEQATKDFQAAEGLEDDGIPGKLTQAALLDAVAKGRFKQTSTQPETGDGTQPLWWQDIRYFTREEFRCKCGGKYCNGFPAEPSETLVRLADQVRKHFGSPMIVSSGLRCQQHNDNQPGSVPNSRHIVGKAVDFSVIGHNAVEVLSYVVTLPEIRYAYQIDGSYVHMDVL